MDPGVDKIDLREQVWAVKDNIIGQKTASIYVRGIFRYVAWLYKRKRHLLRDTFLGTLHSSDLEQDDSGITSLKLDNIARFMEEKREISPLNYDLHEPDDFEGLLMSLRGRGGGKPGQSVYDSMRSSGFHLYRGYGIRYESTGDRIVGRYVADLPFDDTDFAVLHHCFKQQSSSNAA